VQIFHANNCKHEYSNPTGVATFGSLIEKEKESMHGFAFARTKAAREERIKQSRTVCTASHTRKSTRTLSLSLHHTEKCTVSVVPKMVMDGKK
jgi:hypothetical protein